MSNNLISPEIKSLVESNPVAISTVMENGNPNVIGVAFVKVVNEKLIITDNFMNQTLKDIKHNNNVALIVWNNNLEGYKFIGKANYKKFRRLVELCKKHARK